MVSMDSQAHHCNYRRLELIFLKSTLVCNEEEDNFSSHVLKYFKRLDLRTCELL